MKKIVYDQILFKDRNTGEYLSFPTVKGDQGDTGKSAYESAVELGFTGTEVEWIESLKYVSSPEYDTLMASLVEKEANAATSATEASESAEAAKNYYDQISGLKGFEVVVLEEGEYSADGVPTIADPKDSVFYFVPSGNGGTNNFNEYVYVNNAFEMVGAKEVDLTPYALSSELSKYVLTSTLSDYATVVSLEDYVKSSELDSYVLNSELGKYVKSEELNNYATTESLKNYVQNSELNNYATVASLDNYATVSSLDDYALASSLDDYTTTTVLSRDYALKSELVTDSEKATWNAKYDLPTTGIPEEALSTDVRVKLNSFFEADPVDKDLLAQYAMKTELLDYQLKSDMTPYAKTADVNNTLKSYVKSSDITDVVRDSELDVYAKKTDLNAYAKSSDLTDVVRSSELDNYVESSTLNDYATVASLDDYALKSDIDDLIDLSVLDNYALKSELSNSEQRAAWSAKYDLPEGGIPLTDLAQDVQDVINDPKIEVDDTLTIEGAAAEAKTTGDILATKLGPEDIVKFIQWDNAVDGITMSTTNNMVIMTEEEYNKLKVKLANTFYFIYDDTDEANAYDL